MAGAGQSGDGGCRSQTGNVERGLRRAGGGDVHRLLSFQLHQRRGAGRQGGLSAPGLRQRVDGRRRHQRPLPRVRPPRRQLPERRPAVAHDQPVESHGARHRPHRPRHLPPVAAHLPDDPFALHPPGQSAVRRRNGPGRCSRAFVSTLWASSRPSGSPLRHGRRPARIGPGVHRHGRQFPHPQIRPAGHRRFAGPKANCKPRSRRNSSRDGAGLRRLRHSGPFPSPRAKFRQPLAPSGPPAPSGRVLSASWGRTSS